MSGHAEFDPIDQLRTRWRQTCFLALFTLALTSVVFHGVIWGDQTLVSAPTLNFESEDRTGGGFGYSTDPWAGNLMEGPGIALNQAALQSGDIPTWNRREGCGSPHLGNGELGTLSLFQLPTNLVGTVYSWDLLAVVRIAIAAFGAGLLALAFGMSPVACAFAGIGFAWSGSFLLHSNLIHLSTTMLLPFILIGVEGILARATAKRVVFLGLATAIALNGGNPQPLAVTAVFVFFRILLVREPIGSLRALPALLLSATIALLLASPTLLPLLDAIQGSPARDDLNSESGALGLASLLSYIMPQHKMGDGGIGPADHLSIGVITSLLFLVSLRYRTPLPRAFAWAPLPLIILIHTAVLPDGVTILRWVIWSKYVGLLHLLLALGAASVLNQMMMATSAHWRRGAALLLLAAATELIFLFPSAGSRAPTLLPPAPTSLRGAIDESLRLEEEGLPQRFVALNDFCPPLVSGSLGLNDVRSVSPVVPQRYLEWAGTTCNSGSYLRHMLLSETMEFVRSPFMDLAGVRWIGIRDHRMLAPSDRGPVNETPASRFGALHRSVRPGTLTSQGLLKVNASNAAFELAAGGSLSLNARPLGRALALSISASFDGKGKALVTINRKSFSLGSGQSARLTADIRTSDLTIDFGASNSTTVFTLDEWNLERPQLKPASDYSISPVMVDPDSGTSVIINEKALPIARIAGRVIALDDHQAMQDRWERLLSDGEGWDWREEVLVVTDRSPPVAQSDPPLVRMHWLDSDTFEARTKTGAPSFLHIAVTNDGNWAAFKIHTDGRREPLDLCEANGPFMGVFMDDVGAQTIRFEHSLNSWNVACILLLAGCVLAVLLSVPWGKLPRRQK